MILFYPVGTRDAYATGINATMVDNEQNTGNVYDLQGRRLNHQIARKGLYIKDGKKIIVR